MAEDDLYVYPGTDILRNHLGIREATELAAQEAALSSIRIAQLERRFIPGDYDLTHLKATHGYVFGEMYPWAGELRTVRIAQGGDLFALPEHIDPYLTTLLADLAREDLVVEDAVAVARCRASQLRSMTRGYRQHATAPGIRIRLGYE